MLAYVGRVNIVAKNDQIGSWWILIIDSIVPFFDGVLLIFPGTLKTIDLLFCSSTRDKLFWYVLDIHYCLPKNSLNTAFKQRNIDT